MLELRNDFPDAKILLLAIFPRSVPGDPVRDKIAEANRIIAQARRPEARLLLDIGASSSTTKASSCPTRSARITLHPVAKGYDIWGEAVKEKLAELLR